MSLGLNNTLNGTGIIPGIQLALDSINDDPNILPGYKLNYVLMDSQCNHNVALDALFKQIISDIPKVGIIGSGCSVATEPTAEISHYYNITQLSCVSSSHFLANRQKYRAYFQMLPTDINLVPSIVAICEKYNWRHIGIIQQEENLTKPVYFIPDIHSLLLAGIQSHGGYQQNL
jgi:gamma-aminobutyric acid type B receptor